jgi:hypothetical protein
MHTVRRATLVALGVLVLAAAGCGGAKVPYHLTGASPVYTLVNLHPDENRNLVYSIHYQREGLIPVCSPVRIHSVTPKKMDFTVLPTGRRYSYVFHNAMHMTPEKHLDLVFARECPKAALDAMSEVDKNGIRAGRVQRGMTRNGVLVALGYPPDHANPTLDAESWRYWINRWKTLVVVFDGDVVSDIVY